MTHQPTPLDPEGAVPQPVPEALARSAASRRQLFRTAGLVALVGAGGSTLAACSSGNTAGPATSSAPSSAAPSAESSSAPSSAAPSSAAPSSPASSAAPSARASSKAPSGPSVATADVPVGGGFIMPNAKYVVTQPSKGTYKAFSKICTHQGCPVSQIVNREIVCRCHNSHFSIADGSVISGPAQRPLPAAKTKVSGDEIVVSD